MENRNKVYQQAKKKNPERWAGVTRNWSLPEEVWLNPEKAKNNLIKEIKTAS